MIQHLHALLSFAQSQSWDVPPHSHCRQAVTSATIHRSDNKAETCVHCVLFVRAVRARRTLARPFRTGAISIPRTSTVVWATRNQHTMRHREKEDRTYIQKCSTKEHKGTGVRGAGTGICHVEDSAEFKCPTNCCPEVHHVLLHLQSAFPHKLQLTSPLSLGC